MNMQPFYKLFIQDNRYNSYKKLASFLFLINAIIFIFLGLRSGSISNKIILLTTSFLLLIYSIYHWSYKKKKERSYIVLYLLVATVWISDTPFWYFSILFFVLPALQSRMESDFSIFLSGQHVAVNGFIKKIYPWQDLNNVVLKDGLLTLDFKSNRVLQVEPDWNLSIEEGGITSWESGEGYPETEKEFNDFCSYQLRTSNPQPEN